MRPNRQFRSLAVRIAALAVVAALLVASGSVASAALAGAAHPAALPTGRLVPPVGTSLLGAIVVKGNRTSEHAMWDGLEAGAGNNIDLAQVMYSWGQTLPSWRESYHLRHGRIPMISWGWATSTDITSGRYDSYIRRTAIGIKALAGTIFLRWFWEMDGKALASYAVSPSAFKAAWAHIRAIFASVGATNVVWVWTPTAYGFDVGRAQQWYPGNNEVDWIGANGFNWYPAPARGSAKSFAQIFGTFYAWGLSVGKPMMVAATGALETSDPLAKASWIKNIAATIRTTDPGIRAICYLDHTSGAYDDPTLVVHWELTTSINAINAWNSIAKQSVFANAH